MSKKSENIDLKMANKKVVEIFKIEACEAKIDLINQCRICLDNQEEMYDMMSVLGEDESTTVYKVFQNLTGIFLSQDHESSSYICSSCFDKLKDGFTLRITAAETEKKFAKMCSVCMNYNYRESFAENFDAILHLVDETVITVHEIFEMGTGLSVPKNRPNNMVCSKCLHTLIDMQILRNEAQKTHEIMLDILETSGTSDSQEIEQMFEVEPMTTQESVSKDQQHEGESQSANDYIDDGMIKSEEAEEHLEEAKQDLEEAENAGTSYEEIKHEIKKEELYCTVCLKEFNFSEDLNRHMETHKNSKPYKCQVCSEEFTRAAELRNHIFRSHKEMKCRICLEGFNNYRDVIRHMRTHKKRTYVCDVCAQVCSTQAQLTGHMRIHTKEKPFACDICSKRFTLKNGLKTHMHTHNTEKLFQCALCSKKFRSLASLYCHKLTHSDKRPHECTICWKGFKTRSSLGKHILIHTGVRNFQCPHCPSKFIHQGVLKSHLTIHSTEPKIFCEVCNKPFNRIDNYKIHMRIHNNIRPYVCSICNKGFTVSRDCREHIATHSTEKKYPCKKCDKRFKTARYLWHHMRRCTETKEVEEPKIEI